MENFTPGSAILGGAAIGIAMALFLLTTGRVAGISGISGGILFAPIADKGWRIVFIAGLIGGVLVY
ncbi:MAG: YeeE/YedE family protein, partial [Alphaproteobacteria bacterium]|nr:YeeE/YedE family protein [Alphaproteobacteria bacterium]